MGFFKVKVGEDTYELEQLTLGDTRLLSKRFGLKSLDKFDTTDPDVLVGLMTLAVMKRDGVGADAAEATVEALSIEDFQEAEPEADPTPPAKAKPRAGAARAKAGS